MVIFVQIGDHRFAVVLQQKLPREDGITAVEIGNALDQAVEDVRRQHIHGVDAVALAALPAQRRARRPGEDIEVVAVSAVNGEAGERADVVDLRAGVQNARVVAVFHNELFAAGGGGLAVAAALAAEDAAGDDAAGDHAGVIAGVDEEAAAAHSVRDAHDAADAAGRPFARTDDKIHVVGDVAGVQALVQSGFVITAGIDAARDAADAGGLVDRDVAGVHAALQCCILDKADKAAECAAAVAAVATAKVAAAGVLAGDASLKAAVGEGGRTGHAGKAAKIGVAVGQAGDGDLHVGNAVFKFAGGNFRGHTAHGNLADIRERDLASDGQVGNLRATVGKADQAGIAGACLADVQAGNGVALSVKAAAIGAAARLSDGRPLAVAEVDVCGQDRLGGGRNGVVVDALCEPGKLCRRTDLINAVLLLRLGNRFAVPCVRVARGGKEVR